MQILLHELPYFKSQRLSLFVLVRNKVKVLALKELVFSTDKKIVAKRGYSEIYLYINLSTTFSDRPILFTNRDIIDY